VIACMFVLSAGMQTTGLSEMAVAMAAVTAILTPMSHHNLIIYGPGGYKFFDYTRVGAPLTRHRRLSPNT
jgi:di/tricarboxylate transporter